MSNFSFTYSTVSGATAIAADGTQFLIPQSNPSSSIAFDASGLAIGNWFNIANFRNDPENIVNISINGAVFQITDNVTTPTISVQSGCNMNIQMRAANAFLANPV